jgi:hypothetical protein
MKKIKPSLNLAESIAEFQSRVKKFSVQDKKYKKSLQTLQEKGFIESYHTIKETL